MSIFKRLLDNLKLWREVSLYKAPLSLLLVPLVIVNVLEFAFIDSQTGERYQAIHIFDSSNIIDTGLNSPSLRPTLLPWVVLADIAPNSTLYVPKSDKAVHNSRFYAFADGEHVIYVENDEFTDVISEINPDRHVAAIGYSKPEYESSFAVVLSGESDRELEQTTVPGYFIDDDLTPQPKSGFLLVKWSGTFSALPPKIAKNGEGLYWLFIDIELLPVEVQKRLQSL